MSTIQATDFLPLRHQNNTALKSKSQVDPDKAWQAAQDFEASFTSHVIQQMFAGNESGLFGGGQTEVMFRSLWAHSLAAAMPGAFGIAESVYPILLKGQEATNVKSL